MFYTYDLNSMVDQEVFLIHDSMCYFYFEMINYCNKYRISYDEHVPGALCVAPNLQGLYAPIYSIGPEYILSNAALLNIYEREELEAKFFLEKKRFSF